MTSLLELGGTYCLLGALRGNGDALKRDSCCVHTKVVILISCVIKKGQLRHLPIGSGKDLDYRVGR